MAQFIRIDRTTTLQWFGGETEAFVRRELNRRMLTAVSMVQQRVRENINIPVFPRSLPGEYPRRETGNLHQSISTEVFMDRGMLMGDIGTSVPYSLVLEKVLYREFLSRVLREESGAIVRIFRRRIL